MKVIQLEGYDDEWAVPDLADYPSWLYLISVVGKFDKLLISLRVCVKNFQPLNSFTNAYNLSIYNNIKHPVICTSIQTKCLGLLNQNCLKSL